MGGWLLISEGGPILRQPTERLRSLKLHRRTFLLALAFVARTMHTVGIGGEDDANDFFRFWVIEKIASRPSMTLSRILSRSWTRYSDLELINTRAMRHRSRTTVCMNDISDRGPNSAHDIDRVSLWLWNSVPTPSPPTYTYFLLNITPLHYLSPPSHVYYAVPLLFFVLIMKPRQVIPSNLPAFRFILSHPRLHWLPNNRIQPKFPHKRPMRRKGRRLRQGFS